MGLLHDVTHQVEAFVTAHDDHFAVQHHAAVLLALGMELLEAAAAQALVIVGFFFVQYEVGKGFPGHRVVVFLILLHIHEVVVLVVGVFNAVRNLCFVYPNHFFFHNATLGVAGVVESPLKHRVRIVFLLVVETFELEVVLLVVLILTPAAV